MGRSSQIGQIQRTTETLLIISTGENRRDFFDCAHTSSRFRLETVGFPDWLSVRCEFGDRDLRQRHHGALVKCAPGADGQHPAAERRRHQRRR